MSSKSPENTIDTRTGSSISENLGSLAIVANLHSIGLARLQSYIEVHGRTGNDIKSNKVRRISVGV